MITNKQQGNDLEKKMEPCCFVWQDAQDSSTFLFGVRLSSNFNGKPKYSCWFSAHIDAVHDIFGKEAYKLFETVGTEPTPIKFTISKY